MLCTSRILLLNPSLSFQGLRATDLVQTLIVRKTDLEDHEAAHSGDARHACPVCGKMFVWRKEVKRHMKVHAEPRFPCRAAGCGEIFKTKAELHVHDRLHNPKPYVCGVCQMGFTRKDYLQRHERGHEKKRPYECRECGKGFMFEHKLVEHRRVHTGEKPFACHLCPSKFHRRECLHRHYRCIHQVQSPAMLRKSVKGVSKTQSGGREGEAKASGSRQGGRGKV